MLPMLSMSVFGRFEDRLAEYWSVTDHCLLSTVHIAFSSCLVGRFADYCSAIGYFTACYLEKNSVIGRADRGARIGSVRGNSMICRVKCDKGPGWSI